MITIPGYQITEIVCQNTQTTLYRGIDNQGNPLVFKMTAQQYPAPQDIARIRLEYHLLQSLDIAGIPHTHALIKQHNRLILVMSDLGQGYRQVHHHKLTLDIFFDIAIALVEILGQLHRHDIIHQNINPANLTINPRNGKVALIDFNLATRLNGPDGLGSESRPALNLQCVGTSLAYMSPEQTGRVNRVIDYRSDFYALGITFYEMLLGQLPFESDDPMKLIHAHLAIKPEPLYKLDPTIPATVSHIITRLLHKKAEDRYLSAQGLLDDLQQCHTQWRKNAAIDDFPLGKTDIPDRFAISDKIYGREKELATLHGAFDKATKDAALVLVSGYSGVGKSFLIEEAKGALLAHGGHFIGGKFDMYKQNIPFSALFEALGERIRHILTGSSAAIKSWHRKIRDKVGTCGQLLTDVLPELELILDKQSMVAPLQGEEGRHRFFNVLEDFVGVFTDSALPLVLFLDDLQWADSSSLEFLQRLLIGGRSHKLLLLGAYRDNEIDAGHPLMLTVDKIGEKKTITRMVLQALDQTSCNQMVADTMHTGSKQSAALTRVLQQKTQGNPFFLKQLLHTLQQQQLLHFDWQQHCWSWDIEKIELLDSSDNVVELMIGKINNLDPATGALLALAACLGNRFDLLMLAIINNTRHHQTAALLRPALSQGLIKPLTDEYRYFQDEDIDAGDPSRVIYKFVHDRIYEAAYALMDDDEASRVHLRIGRMLQKKTDPASQSADIFNRCHHLNAGSRWMTSQSERNQLAGLNLMAAQKAMAAAAYVGAGQYLEKGLTLLDQACWADCYALTLDLTRYSAYCAYMCGQQDNATTLFERCLAHTRSCHDQAMIQVMMINHFLLLGSYTQGFTQVRQALSLFDIGLPEKRQDFAAALETEAQHIERLMADRPVDSLLKLPMKQDRQIALVAELLQLGFATTYPLAGMGEISRLAAIKIVTLSLQHGHTEYTSMGYMFYGIYLIANRRNYRRGAQFGELAIALQSRQQHPLLKQKIYAVYGHLINHYVNPLDNNIALYEESYRLCRQNGDLWWGLNAVYGMMLDLLAQGQMLGKVYHTGRRFLDFVQQSGNKALYSLHLLHMQIADKLMAGDSPRDSLDGDCYQEADVVALMKEADIELGLFCHDLYASSYYFHRRSLDQALVLTQRAEAAKHCTPGSSHFTNQQFYHSLILCACLDNNNESGKNTCIAQIKNDLSALRSYAEFGASNYQAKFLLVSAELAQHQGDALQAMAHYDAAIEAAQCHNQIHIQGLAAELAARFHHRQGRLRVAAVCINEAVACYNLWQADALVADLQRAFPQYLSLPTVADSQHHRQTLFGANWDLSSLLKATRAIAQETDLHQLLATMIQLMLENAGAQRAVLLLNRDQELLVEAQGDIGQQAIEVLQSQTPADAGLPEEVIHYITRTGEEVVLDNALTANMFKHSDYIRQNQVQSLACLPIRSRGELLAMIYVENNSAAGAFTAERIEILRLLSSQAAISIENAWLRKTRTVAEFEYCVGGSLHCDAPCYIPRAADNRLYQALQGGEFCYVLNSRQMGKSSLRVNTMQRLKQAGVACVSVDISAIGSQQVSLEQWYAGIARILLAGLDLIQAVNLRTWWRQRLEISPVQRLIELIENEIITRLSPRPVVIFIDEIDSVLSLGFDCDDFFAAIRALYNKRADDPLLKRLNFVLLGVALPYELIRDKKRTPFNIGVAVHLQGFCFSEARPLARGLAHKSDAPETLLREIISWTQGQPFLSQKICRLLAAAHSKPGPGKEKVWVAKQIAEKVILNWEVQDQPEHLITIRTRILRSQCSSQELLILYRKILLAEEIPYDGSRLQEELILSGLVSRQWDRLRVGNTIYSSVFNLDWVAQALAQT